MKTPICRFFEMNSCGCKLICNLLCLNSKNHQISYSRRKICLKYRQTTAIRSISSNAAGMKKIYLKQLSMKTFKIISMSLGLSTLAFGIYALVIEDDEFLPIENKNLPFIIKIYERICFRVEFYHKMFTIPATNKLLPDPLPDYYDKPKFTLVLEMTDFLVHPEWSYSTGWRFKKRPNVDYFLEQIGKNFEVVVYTAENGYIASPILDEIDPKGWIQYRLSRQCTELQNGQLVKNMDRINRDLTKVIVIDWNSSWTQLQPNNTLIIPRWTGDDHNNSLIDLADFLKVVFTSDVNDVREILHEYKQFEDPIKAFRENRRILKQENEKKEVIKEETQKVEDNKKSWFSWIPWFY